MQRALIIGKYYTLAQVALPKIKAMIAKGKIQRKVAGYYGLKGCLSVSGVRKKSHSSGNAAGVLTGTCRCGCGLQARNGTNG